MSNTSPRIRIKDFATDAMVEISYSEIARASAKSPTQAEILRQVGTVTIYDFGLDGMRRLREWLLTNGPVGHTGDENAWFVQTTVLPVERLRSLDMRPALAGSEALADLISHETNLLSAMDARIRLARVADLEKLATDDPAEPPQGPADANESYWKRERTVVERMIAQARMALGRDKPKDAAA